MFKKTVWILSIVTICLFFSFHPILADKRFTDNSDGTVTDHLLGVMWGKEDTKGDVDWKSAERWVKYTFPYSLSAEKRDGWRLPTLKELKSLYVRDKGYKGYETDCGQKVRIVSQIKLSCGWVWSSEKKNITAVVYNFQRGYHYTDRRVLKKAYRALAVKDLNP